MLRSGKAPKVGSTDEKGFGPSSSGSNQGAVQYNPSGAIGPNNGGSKKDKSSKK